MWILRAARDARHSRGGLTPPVRPFREEGRPARAVLSRSLLAACCVALLAAPPATHAEAPAATQAQADELILTVRINGVARGEVMLLRQPQGDFWIRAEDLSLLKLEPVPE